MQWDNGKSYWIMHQCVTLSEVHCIYKFIFLLPKQVEPSVNEEVGPLVSAILAEAIGGDDYISGGSTASSSSSNDNGGLASVLIHAGSNFAIGQMLGSGGDSGSDNSGASDGDGGILSSITSLFG